MAQAHVLEYLWYFWPLCDHFLRFAQDDPFIKCVWFWNLLVVLEKHYVEQIVGNRFLNFCIWRKKSNRPEIFYTKTCTFLASTPKRSNVLYTQLKISEFLKLVTIYGGFIQFLLCIGQESLCPHMEDFQSIGPLGRCFL